MTFKTTERVIRRIHIIGGPGSGKSDLARKLGKYLGIPIYHLDELAFEGRYFTKRPLDARLADVRRIAVQPAWVTEGIFLGWTDELLCSADVIVWLDGMTWPGAIWRISVRTARWSLQEAKRQPGVRKFTRFGDYSRNLRLFLGVLASSRRYYRSRRLDRPAIEPIESRIATAQQLAPYWAKVVHCHSEHEVQVFVAGIGIEAQDGYTPQKI